MLSWMQKNMKNLQKFDETLIKFWQNSSKFANHTPERTLPESTGGAPPSRMTSTPKGLWAPRSVATRQETSSPLAWLPAFASPLHNRPYCCLQVMTCDAPSFDLLPNYHIDKDLLQTDLQRNYNSPPYRRIHALSVKCIWLWLTCHFSRQCFDVQPMWKSREELLGADLTR